MGDPKSYFWWWDKETLECIRVLGFWRTMYGTFLYRKHMRFIHRLGRCWFKQYKLLPNIKKCNWCGNTKSIPHPHYLAGGE